MNERKFLKKLNSKVNKDRDLTPAIVEELLSEGQALVVKKRMNILPIFFKRKNTKQIIEDNFEVILDKTDYFQLNVLLAKLMNNWQTSEIVKEKFDTVMKRFNFAKEEEQERGDAVTLGSEKVKFYEMCRKTYTHVDDLLVKHMNTIIQGGVTIEELKYLRGLSEEVDEKLNSELESHKQEVAKELLSSISLTRMIEELLVDQDTRMVDIQRTGRGAYSKVYEIGEKVLKIGKPRETYKIPNHPRILQPLTRTNLIDERDGDKVFACAEISDRVDKLSEEDMQVEKLYQVYKELRDDEIIWTDARFSNVGKLRRRNIPKLNGEEMDVDPVAVGMDKEIKGRVLEVGEWVVIDTDFIYRERDSSLIWIANSYSAGFEKRWQQERQGKIVAEYQKDGTARTQEECTKSYEVRSWEKDKKKKEEEER